MVYQILEGSTVKSSFNKRIFIYFLGIVCPLLSLLILSTYNVMNICYNYPDLDNQLLSRWNREVDSLVKDFYLFDSNSLEDYIIEYNEKVPDPPKPSDKLCSAVIEAEKFDCLPRGLVTQDACTKKGCCYSESSGNVPSCFFPPAFQSYTYSSINRTEKELSAELTLKYNLFYPSVPPKVYLKAVFLTDSNLLVTVLPYPFPSMSEPYSTNGKTEESSGVTDNVLYDFVLDSNSTGFKVIRKSTKTAIFDSRDIGGFIYSNLFVQISAKIPCKHIYGLGEGRTDLPLSTNWTVRTLWNHDTVPTDGVNGYGSYPMYLCAEGNGLAHTVTFLNSFAIDFILQPGAITYRSVGPPLAIQFTLGPSPLQAVTQIANMYKSFMPPYWALGFHLCRFGYKSVEDIKRVWNSTRAAGIPYDTQWVDIDYMNNRNDFTIGENFTDLGKFVDMLHKNGMHFVPILDPGISGSEPKGKYPPYDRGMELDIFVKDSYGKKPLVGKVWNPVSTVFPDFTHPKVIPYWIEMLKSLYKNFEFDGIWLDMNEPSNFVNGSINGCPKNILEDPPYVPAVQGGKLKYHTLCMSAKHSLGPHYAVHNSYGVFEAVATNFALTQIRGGKRPLVITRASTFMAGTFAGHWTGDVISSWDDMAQSVKDIIQMSMYGVHLVGADICGFNGNTTVELCRRWQQLGAFYPFSRNHNTDDGIPQDPVSLNIVDSTKKALLLRYSLLPYLYTLFWQANNNGTPVIRPLFYLFPNDEASYRINSQFMWGDGLLISPVLKEGHTYVKAYLGNSIWYDMYTSAKIISNSSQIYALPAPEDTIPVHIRGGTILVMQEPNVTTTLTRQNPFHLKVALDGNNQAKGMLFWDDGDTNDGNYSTVYFGIINNTLMSCNDIRNYKIDRYINRIEIFSLNSVKQVTLNQKTNLQYNFNGTTNVLALENLKLDIQTDFNITWT
ncbi:hypothetical protein O3M35_001450 [Rhynocoris fuscipes]|uniref:P-type domain-containing protein n=1 Tax=Rhynocoris fuscipes TaxID=488301 RepID=A0AAW1CV58_9HEMI